MSTTGWTSEIFVSFMFPMILGVYVIKWYDQTFHGMMQQKKQQTELWRLREAKPSTVLAVIVLKSQLIFSPKKQQKLNVCPPD